MQVKVIQVNAFTANSSGGNPAGIVLGADDLTDAQMLKIAKRANFSETAFVSNSSTATRNVKFFTPAGEVDLCGHATIATWFYMFQQGILPIGNYTQNTKAGMLKIEISERGCVYMEQKVAQFSDNVPVVDILPVLNINASVLHPSLNPQVVSTGLRDLLVPVANNKVLNKINPNFDAMSKLSNLYDIVGLHVFAPLVNQYSIAAARNFAPLYGIDEEAATGTSNGALICYLREHGALKIKKEYRIEQGMTMGSLSHVNASLRDGVVWVGGTSAIIKEFAVEV